LKFTLVLKKIVPIILWPQFENWPPKKKEKPKTKKNPAQKFGQQNRVK
jgi:hypothetical protein